MKSVMPSAGERRWMLTTEKYQPSTVMTHATISMHMLIMSFTHSTGYFVIKNPVLLNNISIFSISIPIYNLLQHSSTLIGGIIILLYISKLKPANNIEQSEINNYWIKIIVIAMVITLLRIVIGGFGRSITITFVVTVVAAVLYALVITSLFFKKKICIKRTLLL